MKRAPVKFYLDNLDSQYINVETEVIYIQFNQTRIPLSVRIYRFFPNITKCQKISSMSLILPPAVQVIHAAPLLASNNGHLDLPPRFHHWRSECKCVEE
jgi:hypothetical protein